MQIAVILCLSGFGGAQTATGVDSGADRQSRIETMKKELRKIIKTERVEDFQRLQAQLAQLGQQEQLQQILCEMDFGDPPAVRVNAIAKLSSVGGWFAVSSAAKFLGNNAEYIKPRSDLYGIYPSLQAIALNALPHLVASPPLGEIPAKTSPMDYSSEIHIWMEWLRNNRDSLVQLQPTGDGLVSSESVCRKVLQHDLVNTYYHTHVKQHGTVKIN